MGVRPLTPMAVPVGDVDPLVPQVAGVEAGDPVNGVALALALAITVRPACWPRSSRPSRGGTLALTAAAHGDRRSRSAPRPPPRHPPVP